MVHFVGAGCGAPDLITLRGARLLEEADQIISLPMSGQINSLNASVAAGILMYEVARQRQQIRANN